MSKTLKTKSTPSTDAIKDLLLWARKERIMLAHVQVGDVVLTVTRDLRMASADDGRAPAEEARKSIYEQYAGPLNLDPPPEVAETEPTLEPTEEDDD